MFDHHVKPSPHTAPRDESYLTVIDPPPPVVVKETHTRLEAEIQLNVKLALHCNELPHLHKIVDHVHR